MKFEGILQQCNIDLANNSQTILNYDRLLVLKANKNSLAKVYEYCETNYT